MKNIDYASGLMELFIKTGNIAFMSERLHYLRTGEKTVLPPVKEFLHPELNALNPSNSTTDLTL